MMWKGIWYAGTVWRETALSVPDVESVFERIIMMEMKILRCVRNVIIMESISVVSAVAEC